MQSPQSQRYTPTQAADKVGTSEQTCLHGFVLICLTHDKQLHNLHPDRVALEKAPSLVKSCYFCYFSQSYERRDCVHTWVCFKQGLYSYKLILVVQIDAEIDKNDKDYVSTAN